MNRSTRQLLAVVVACGGMLHALDAHAFRMIQNSSVGRTSIGAQVICTDPGGFAHWTTPSLTYWLNPANQGGKPGVLTALQNAMASWTAVTPATYTLRYAGTTTRGFATDGVNTVVWEDGDGCSGSCLAITALVLQAGQVITEADISFNNSATWNTNGTDYDVEAIAAHELGHTLGIHHTDLTKSHNRPTMYANYFGIPQRSLESDDWAALNCSFNRYPVSGATPIAYQPAEGAWTPEPVLLAARPNARGANLRFALERQEHVRLDLFDVAGRRIATLVDDVRDPGEYEMAWDGATDLGHVASGVYFARVATPEGKASATVILAR